MTGGGAAAKAAAIAIQAVGELGRGLDVLDAELRAGDVTGARDTAGAMRALVAILDLVIPSAVRR